MFKPGHRSNGQPRRAKSSGAKLPVETLEARVLLAAQPIITEFMASNGSTIEDGFGNDSDWIELHNAGDEPVDLLGHFLTDKADEPQKWAFTESTVLEPGAYQVVFASNADTTDPLGYVHTNFRLSAGGEHLQLRAPDGTLLSGFGVGGVEYPQQVSDISYGLPGTAGQVVVNGQSAAGWLVPSDNSLGTDWTQIDFDTIGEGFGLGQAAIGYETNGGNISFVPFIETEIPDNTTTTYVRIPFSLADADAFAGMTLDIHFDDGFVAYLNGTRVAARHEPATLDHNSVAAEQNFDVDAIAGETIDLSAFVDLLEDGDNVLAIHALNTSGSSDYLMVPTLSLVSGSDPNGPTGYLADATPGWANTVLEDLGPLIEVTESVVPPNAGQSVVITAELEALSAPVDASTIRLHYRQGFGSESSVVMRDDGLGADAVSGDGEYTAEIPGAGLSAGEMLRWRVTADDTAGTTGRMPFFRDPLNSAEYFGTVAVDPAIDTDLALMQWFVANPAAASTSFGTRASLYYRGKFYDNIQVDGHGQSTAGPDFPKKSFDFDANSGAKFEIADGSTASDFNLLTNYADQTKLRNTLAYGVFERAGAAYHLTHPVTVYQNGDFYGLYDFVEEGDEEYLERLGLNSNNPLYKINNPLESATDQVEKKSREWEGNEDLEALVAAESLTGNAADRWDFDHLDIADWVNYLAVQAVISGADFGHKNQYLYRDTEGTGLWSVLPWDLDLTLGHRWNPSLSSPYFDPALNTTDTIYNGWNAIIQRLYDDPQFSAMYHRRVRTLMDDVLGAPGTSTSQSYLGGEMATLAAQTADEAVADEQRWGHHPNFTMTPEQAANQLLDSFVGGRRSYLEGLGAIPNPQAGTPALIIHQTDFAASDPGGDALQDYVRIQNPTGSAVDLSGWTLSNGIEHTFKPGTVIPSGGSLYVVADVAGFKDRASGPSGGQELFIQGHYAGQLTNTSEVVELRSDAGTLVSTLAILSDAAPQVIDVAMSSAQRPDLLQVLSVVFDQDVAIDVAALQLIDPNEVAIDLSLATFSYDAPSRTAAWDFAGTVTPAGTYQLGLIASEITGQGNGTALDGNGDGNAGDAYVATFDLTRPGDANQDGVVNLLDLDVLGQNWQSSGAGVAWTTGDFNADGVVTLLDLDILGANWDTSAVVSRMRQGGSLGAGGDDAKVTSRVSPTRDSARVMASPRLSPAGARI